MKVLHLEIEVWCSLVDIRILGE